MCVSDLFTPSVIVARGAPRLLLFARGSSPFAFSESHLRDAQYQVHKIQSRLVYYQKFLAFLTFEVVYSLILTVIALSLN